MKGNQPNDREPGGLSSAKPGKEEESREESATRAARIRRSSSLQDRDRQRKAPAHFSPRERDARSIIIFVTICTFRRRPLLANAAAEELLVDAWQRADRWRIGRYVIMPDHMHFFCGPAFFPGHPFKAWLSYWRNDVTRRWPRREETPIWQPNFWDRQLRREESYARKWGYVMNNPVRQGLVDCAEDWPYQGELNVLHWHD